MTGTTSPSGLHLPQYLREDDGRRAPPSASPTTGPRALRAPLHAPVDLPQRLTEVTGPLLGEGRVTAADADLTRQHDGEPLGQRIIVHGRVLDSDGRPVPDTLVEVWQANAGGRYRHVVDNWPSPLDPNFTGLGRALTDARAATSSRRSSPAPTRGATTTTPGGRRTSTSRCSAARSPSAWSPRCTSRTTRCSARTRSSTRSRRPRGPLAISRFDYERTVPEWALAFEWDIVLRGTDQTPFETDDDGESRDDA